MKIILEYSSKQRQDIFKMIGLKYEVVTSNVDEMSNEKNPEKYVEELSLNKAKSVKDKIKNNKNKNEQPNLVTHFLVFFNNIKRRCHKSFSRQ